MNVEDLPAECPVTVEHLYTHIVSALGSLGLGDWEQIVHDLDIALTIARELVRTDPAPEEED